jgi:GntR family transcriptional regulator
LPPRAQPLYEQVDARIRERLVNGQWRPGMMIPSEQQLAREFDVSQGTVRRAIEALVNESVLTRRQGAGTFVAELTERRSLNLYFNFVAGDGSRTVPESRLLRRSAGVATADVTRSLGIVRRSRTLTFERLRLLAGQPVILETIVVPESYFPGLGAHGDLPNHLFWHYEAKYGISVVRAEEQLRAVSADARAADVLAIEPGAPLLAIDRVAFALDGRAVELRRSRCNTAHHYYIARRGG